LSKENLFDVQFSTNLIPGSSYPLIDWINVESISIQKIYDYRVYGKVDRKGNVDGFYSVRRIDNEFIDENISISRNEIYDNSLSGNSSPNLFDQNNENETGEYYFDIRVYDIGERDNLDKLAQQSKFESGTKFKSAFKNLQGLRISKNGFGVKPYGDEVEDWIGLSKERLQNPGQNISTNQIIGYVYFFSPENEVLEEKTNREGFIENTAFSQVKTSLAAIFKDLGRRRYNYRLAFGLGRIPDSKHKRPDFDSFLERLKSSQYADERIISYSEKFMKEVNTSMDNLEESLTFAERLASLGSGIELVYHEMAQPISGLISTKSSLDLKIKKMDPSVLDFYIRDINNLAHASEVLVELRESLQPAIGRTRKKRFSPYDTFMKVVNLFKSDLDEYKITVSGDERLKDFFIDDFEYAFWISFLNIVNNAVYWIKKSERECEIRFYVERDKLIISNNGPLIKHDIIDHIFKYGVTARSEKNATGLGLAFTQSILSRNNWNITAKNSEFGPTFIISKIEDNE
jgi:signal transduction histidine kinase